MFDVQWLRLAERWKGVYASVELKKEIWGAVWKLPNDFIVEAVRYFVGYTKTPPLMGEFEAQIIRWERRQAERRLQSNESAGGLLGQVQRAAREHLAVCTEPDSKEFVLKCVEVVKGFTGRRMSRENFDQACDTLDRVALILTRTKAVKTEGA